MSRRESDLAVGSRGAGWRELLSGKDLLLSSLLCGGVALHAINLYVSTTILPSVVQDIGGIEYYAWNTTAFVVASILGAAMASRLLGRAGPKLGYIAGALVFAAGSACCALAPEMWVMLAGRGIQGFGGGVLLALAYALIQRVFAEPLWPRALALLSSMWGIATLLGPAVGGIFAELGNWRAAFGSLVLATGVLVSIAAIALPGRGREAPSREPVPWAQLALLTAAVLAASWASLASGSAWIVACVVLACVLVRALIHVDNTAGHRLFPRNTFKSGSILGALYAVSALMAVSVTCTEIFLPLFLQELQGHSPLVAGYIAAVMSAGWTVAAVMSAGLRGAALDRAAKLGPALSLVSLIALAIILPSSSFAGTGVPTLLTAIALAAAGMGVGMIYPHLSARIMRTAPADEQDSAATSIMTAQLCATAFGAALAGLVVNLAGAPHDGEALDAAAAARWLFAVVALAPAFCLPMLRNSWR